MTNATTPHGLHSRRVIGVLLVGVVSAWLAGCPPKRLVVDMVGNALAGSGGVYASDDDLELVGHAVPFGLKTYESLLAASPRHRGLLLAAGNGFVQYAYAFVQDEADRRALELSGGQRASVHLALAEAHCGSKI
jgi:TRAP transporter T-component